MENLIRQKNTLPDPFPERDQDITLIHQLVSDAERFQSDPEKFVQLLAVDAILVNAAGLRIEGRDEIYKIMNKAVQTSLAEIRTKHKLQNIKFIRDDIALVTCIKEIFLEKENLYQNGNTAVRNFVMEKNNGEWLISLAQDTLINDLDIQNINNQKVPSAEMHLADM